ncbi:hypothetical protein HZA97_09030 [Candidatus Woesearchaeota archaeon]|nr:hypothetical protein [Candidatus Woesearchaeota archaeon]
MNKMILEQLLSQRGLVLQSPTAEELRERTKQVNYTTVFYGETYDHTGNTIDSMKYYFFVADLADALRAEGVEVQPVILVADTAACRNVKPDLEYKYLALGEDRANFVRRVSETYGLNLKVLKMSEFINTVDFIKKREDVIDICINDPVLMQLIEKSVPESKVETEKKKGFMYSYDEIATIIDLDVKVGPPREDLYDNIAREVAKRKGTKQLMSLFLTPTFPLGMNWAYFFCNEGIEDHGITAYKGGSKRLQDNRILIGRTTEEQIEDLIDTSFISTNPLLPNPVLDIGIISKIAKQRLNGERKPIQLSEIFYSGEISPEQLKKLVKMNVKQHILEVLK